MNSAQGVIDSLASGHISSSIYDAAHVFMSGVLSNDDQRRLFSKIIASQHADGSWGGRIGYVHDRVINTLAAVVALRTAGVESNIAAAGESFLRRSIPKLLDEAVETIGFELVFPSLLDSAQKIRIDLPYHSKSVQHYQGLKLQKLSKIPVNAFLKPTTLMHSIEAFSFDPSIDYDGLRFANGSFGNSPAATAHYIKQSKEANSSSVEYLQSFSKLDWNIPSIYPFEVFEKAWILYNFLHQGILFGQNYKEQTDYLWKHWQRHNGASISNTFPIIDADDTAVVYIVLRATGYPVDPCVFEQFELDNWYRCFDLERNPSISANIHVLEAMMMSLDYPRRTIAIEKIIRFLNKTFDVSWVDKWHISPYYCISHLILALRNSESALLDRALARLINSQNLDGGWGIGDSSFEETGYALLALRNTVVGSKKTDMIRAGYEFLERNKTNPKPELWVDKGLYTPFLIIDSLGFNDYGG